MLNRIDRIQMAVPQRASAARGWIELLGAEHYSDDHLKGLAANRSRYRLGDGWIELLEPDGAGPIAAAVSRRGAHLYAAGVSTGDFEGVSSRLRDRIADPIVEEDQIHLLPEQTGGHGLALVVSPDEQLTPVGVIDGLYEVTNLVEDVRSSVAGLTELFDLDPSAFVPIESAHYGYSGILTLFHPRQLHRLEMISPSDPEKTMGRFFARAGESLYMAFAESNELALVEERVIAANAAHTAVPDGAHRSGRPLDTLFLHPAALGGMMLGLSRREVAWSWSGQPDRAKASS